jgi:hypothetical protein
MKRSTGAVAATYGILIAIGVLSLLVPSLLMIPAIATIATTGSTALGPFVAFGGTLVLALITGWLGFLLLRALLQRLLGRRRRGLAALLAIPVVLGWMWYLMNPSGAVFQAIENSHVPWLMVLNPYAALSSVMGGAFAEFVASGPAATPAGGPALPLIIWAVITAIYLLAGAALWAGAVRVFAARRD